MIGEQRTYKITDVGGVLIYRAVVQGTNAGEAAKPGAAGAGKCLGFTQEAQATQNKGVRVKEAGRTFAVASAAVAVGDAVDIGDTAGKVRSCQTRYAALTVGGGEAVNVVGFARTAAGADGDVIEVQINVHTKLTPVS